MSVVIHCEIKKKIEVAGQSEKIVREGSYDIKLASPKRLDSSTPRMRVLEFNEDALDEAVLIYGESGIELVKWADYGKMAYARTTFSNLLSGVDTKLKNLLEQFKENSEAIAKYTNFTVEQAQNKILEDEAFAPVVSYFEALKSKDKRIFKEAELGVPSWFKIEKKTDGDKKNSETSPSVSDESEEDDDPGENDE